MGWGGVVAEWVGGCGATSFFGVLRLAALAQDDGAGGQSALLLYVQFRWSGGDAERATFFYA